tara:strand:- start:794 stop:2656 length:1863 start_codon:yes stop_codon:yes gene_type:complete
MCGISGIISSHRPVRPIIKEMASSMNHRGPDNTSTEVIDNLALGHNRLSIIDLSDKANQPMKDASKNFSIVFNGEVFNYKELRDDLKHEGIIFKNNSDTEVLLYGYILYGDEFFKKVRGFYSLAIFDKRKNLLFLTRDYYGKKPLYYSLLNNEFVFGSEIKAILKGLESKPKINFDGLAHFLWKGYFVDGHSIYGGIHSLEPGCSLEINLSDLNVTRKRILKKIKIDVSFDNPERGLDLIQSELTKSINSRMISDVPISYLLSGGVDSSLICYLAGRESKIDSYYLGYDSEDKNFEELSEYLSNKIDSNHDIIRMKPPIFSTALNQMVQLFDEPFGDYSALPSFEIYKIISQKTKVAISGDGADEIFAGYKDAQLFYLRSILNLNNTSNQRPITENLMNALNSKSKLMRYLGYLASVIFLDEGALSTSTYRGGWNHAYRKMIMTKEGYDITGGSYTEDKEINDYNNSGDNPLERYLNYDLKRLTYDFLVKVDRTSMANSLEVRSPFLDTKLLEKLSRANIKNMVDHSQTKKELKAILNTFGLKELTKVKKQGFTPPLLSWMMTKDGISQIKRINDDDFINHLFDRKKLTEMTNTKANISKNQSRLWFLMVLSKWHAMEYS